MQLFQYTNIPIFHRPSVSVSSQYRGSLLTPVYHPTLVKMPHFMPSLSSVLSRCPSFGKGRLLVDHGALSVGTRGGGGWGILLGGIFTVSAVQILHFVSVSGHCLMLSP